MIESSREASGLTSATLVGLASWRGWHTTVPCRGHDTNADNQHSIIAAYHQVAQSHRTSQFSHTGVVAPSGEDDAMRRVPPASARKAKRASNRDTIAGSRPMMRLLKCEGS
jgi:hypothetical protein